MSSGVDSSVTAALLAKQHPGRVSGVYMCNWSSTAKCTEQEWTDVQAVCEVLGIDCSRVNFEADYWTKVFEPMVELYRAGLTPNPDVSCNRHIKFGALLDHLTESHEHIYPSTPWHLATGHYVGVSKANDASTHLLRPKDLAKDQSYYLSTILPDCLDRIMFPLAPYTKTQVRQMAKEFGLPTASKPDSQGLCFVSQEHKQFRSFLQEYIEPTPGNIVTEEGKVVGRHLGLWHATIGQRSGISMPQGDPECQGVWYVSDKKIADNELVIVRGRDHPSLFSKSATAAQFRWLGDDINLSDVSSLRAQFRSLQNQGVPVAAVSRSLQPDSPESLTVEFAEPVRALAPGQYLVLYQGDRVLGSGMITSRE